MSEKLSGTTNVKAEVKGRKLIITIDIKKDFGASKSGKTIIVATTHGGKRIEDAPGVILSLNAYKYPDRDED